MLAITYHILVACLQRIELRVQVYRCMQKQSQFIIECTVDA